MDDKKKLENAEDEVFELADEELENIAGGMEVPIPEGAPAPVGEWLDRDLRNIPLF